MPATDLPLLIDAAQAAGEIARKHWRADPQVWDKGGTAGPVTEADLAVDAHLRAALGHARPEYGWLSEESEDDPARHEAKRIFVVDPIDGTRAFVAGEETWALSLAVAEHGRVMAAVVYLPVMDKLYAAGLGQGAALNGAPLSVSAHGEADGARVLANRPNFRPENWSGPVPNFKRSFRPSLAYRLTLVAEGRYDAMFTLVPAWEWDIAAGSLIVREAGGTVTDRHGAPLRFNTADRRADGVIAAPDALHASIRTRLAW
ncbi:3'(2'),5'-bisphosphate nucleotidase CysQ [Tranquillimonas alkanivorans]|uniref:Myo-inositol-1(Or 4)-monophosphatase n=1 Tax=Tranquillimonas alkanivorans TaxID=441119 RepID=A0A1I5U5J5_9RHOB|nr:3'(2'),5'-bisphosphate nucleotidase CysQ [Tranquillimonas alkanivorans]SFP90197.1 myo-inositol-1(or 4)-monophosphatase [Tranquillimonas alkanivorans]